MNDGTRSHDPHCAQRAHGANECNCSITQGPRHTPGPWGRNIKPASRYPIIFAGRNTHVAQVITRYIPEDQQEANADLIADAPLMLDTLRGLFEHCAMVHKHWGDGANTREANAVQEQARAILARHGVI